MTLGYDPKAAMMRGSSMDDCRQKCKEEVLKFQCNFVGFSGDVCVLSEMCFRRFNGIQYSGINDSFIENVDLYSEYI